MDNNLSTELNHVGALIHQIHDEIDTIVTHPHFTQVTPADQLNFANIATTFLNIDLNLLRYSNEYAHRRVHGGGPFNP
jgi:hypothetical protein